MTTIEARRARIKQLMAEGRVETDALRKQRKDAAKYQQQLESVAETIICGLVSSSKPKSNVSTPKTKSSAPEANTKVAPRVKFDSLATKANEVLKELQAA